MIAYHVHSNGDTHTHTSSSSSPGGLVLAGVNEHK